MQTRVFQVVGAPTQFLWSQVVTPSLRMVGGVGEVVGGGGVFGVLSLEASEAVSLTTVGHSLIERVGRLGGDSFLTVEELQHFFREVVNDFRNVRVDVVVVGFCGTRLIGGSLGNGGVILRRAGQVGFVIPRGQEGNVVCGEAVSGDRFLLGTGGVYDLMPEQTLAATLVFERLSEVGEELASLVHAGLESAATAALLIEVGRAGVEVEEGIDMVAAGASGEVGVVASQGLVKGLASRWQGRMEAAASWWQRRRRGKKHEQPQVYLAQPRRRLTFSVGVILLFLLLASMGFGWQKREREQREVMLAEVLGPARERFTEAEAVAFDNAPRARVLLVEARALVDEGLTVFAQDTDEHGALLKLQQEIDQAYQEVAREWKVEAADVYFDLTLVRPDLFGTRLAVADDRVVVLDPARRVMVELVLGSKQAKVVGGGEVIEGAEFLSAAVGRAVVLADSGLVGIYFSERQPEVLVSSEEVWQRVVAVGSYGGNVYVVDGGTSDIWHYPDIDGGVGARRRWLGPGVVPDFADFADMAIDGDIWILFHDGVLERYRQGARVPFTVSGLVSPLASGSLVATREEGDYLYVLDPEGRRVVVLDKGGAYFEQYEWDGLAGVTDMVVVEEDGRERLLLLSGATLYELPLSR